MHSFGSGATLLKDHFQNYKDSVCTITRLYRVRVFFPPVRDENRKRMRTPRKRGEKGSAVRRVTHREQKLVPLSPSVPIDTLLTQKTPPNVRGERRGAGDPSASAKKRLPRITFTHNEGGTFIPYFFIYFRLLYLSLRIVAATLRSTRHTASILPSGDVQSTVYLLL